MEVAFIPQIFIKFLSPNFYKQNDYNILFSNVILLLLFFFLGSSLIYILSYIPHFCLIDKITGIECPVCGTTRAFCELSAGNLSKAYTYNKTSVLVAMFFIFQIPLRLFSILKNTNTPKINTLSKNFSRLILTIIFINWIIKLFTNH